ncbi:MAG: DUF6266 family protein [Bacteroidales bacterium]
MGKIRSGILGPVAGKVGNVVGGSWRGIDYLRIMPASVSNPRSPGQLNQRGRFVLILRFLQPLLDFLKIGFRAWAVKMSAFNAAMSYNLRHAVTGEFPDFNILFEQVLVSRGSLRPAADVTCSSPQPAQLLVQWTDNSGWGNASPTDRVMIVIYNSQRMIVRYELDVAFRSDGEATMNLPVSFSGEEIQVWVALSSLSELVSSGDRSTISNSVFAGSVVVS